MDMKKVAYHVLLALIVVGAVVGVMLVSSDNKASGDLTNKEIASSDANAEQDSLSDKVRDYVMNSVIYHEEDDDVSSLFHKVMRISDNSYVAVVKDMEPTYPDVDACKGAEGVGKVEDYCTGFQYFKVQIKNGEPFCDKDGDDFIVEDTALPGKLGESAKVWSADATEIKIKQLVGYDYDFGKCVDVDADGVFEYYIFKASDNNHFKTAVLTLADASGNIDGVKNLAVVLKNVDDSHIVQVDMGNKQVFWRSKSGGVEMEHCIAIKNSHADKREELKKFALHGKDLFVVNVLPYVLGGD